MPILGGNINTWNQNILVIKKIVGAIFFYLTAQGRMQSSYGRETQCARREAPRRGWVCSDSAKLESNVASLAK